MSNKYIYTLKTVDYINKNGDKYYKKSLGRIVTNEKIDKDEYIRFDNVRYHVLLIERISENKNIINYIIEVEKCNYLLLEELDDPVRTIEKIPEDDDLSTKSLKVGQYLFF